MFGWGFVCYFCGVVYLLMLVVSSCSCSVGYFTRFLASFFVPCMCSPYWVFGFVLFGLWSCFMGVCLACWFGNYPSLLVDFSVWCLLAFLFVMLVLPFW